VNVNASTEFTKRMMQMNTTKNMMVAIDIETVSQGQRANAYTDGLMPKTGNLKDPAKIKVAIEEKREEARSKHGLHWWTGKIISVAMCGVDHKLEHVIAGHDEADILTELANSLNHKAVTLVGKNSKDFDFPFMIGRYMANNLSVPRVFKDRSNSLDVMDIFSRNMSSAQYGKLADYAHGLGLGEKLLHGGMVQNLYNEILAGDISKWKDITDYNMQDAKLTAEIARRYYYA
jgi:predicted PolB exonuclease-like 3'-5' exonuclease